MTVCYSKEYGWVDISSHLPDTQKVLSLSAMCWVNDNNGWICSSDSNVIYHTKDGGLTFETQNTLHYTKAICMLNDTLGYSGGYDGYVYRTINGGKDWTSIGTIGKTLTSISFPPSSSVGYCCGYSGKIYKIESSTLSSMNSGLTATNLSSISFPGTQGYACGEQVIIHFSGTSWKLDQGYPDATYSSIYMIDSTTGLAVGDYGTIIKTTDGTNWNAQPSNTINSLYSVFFLDTKNGWVVGLNGTILHTTNGGALWNVDGAGLTTTILRSIQFTSPTNGYVIGNKGTLLHYTEITSAVKYQDNKTIRDQNIQIGYINGLVSIKTSGNLPIEKISILDLRGKMQKETMQNNNINTSGLPKGVYFVKYVTNAKTNAVKIVKK